MCLTLLLWHICINQPGTINWMQSGVFRFFFVALAGIDAVNIVVVDYRFGVNVDTNIAIIINIDCQYITIFDIREP